MLQIKRIFRISALLACLCFLPAYTFSDETLKTETVYFGNGALFSITIDLPDSIRIMESMTLVPGAYFLQLNPVADEKLVMLVTIIQNQTGDPISRESFEAMLTQQAHNLLPQAVEDRVIYMDVNVQGGYGRYFTLTDASLVGTTPGPEDYHYVTAYHANYGGTYLLISTILTDDTGSANYKAMLDAIKSVRMMAGP
ncbi:MAG: hypothetical protein FWH12_02705 [Treponema sp.]|nr:hypothetical protein [Treponema sp.]